jgi:cytochrome P450
LGAWGEQVSVIEDKQGEAATWDARLGAWVVDEAAACRAFLTHGSLSPPPYVELYGELEERFGLDFSNLRLAFGHIPLCLHGPQHANARKAIAGQLARRRSAVLSTMAERVALHFGCLGQPGQVELMAQAVEPFVADFMGALIAVADTGFDADSLISRIFSRGMGIAKRKRAEAEVAAPRARIEASGVSDQADVGQKLAMMILGRDALTGTLAYSLRDVLAAGQGMPFAALDWPDLPSSTGVPYIERMAHESAIVEGLTLAPGDRVRIMLRAFGETADPRERAQFFGAGAHTCLGRPIALEAWAAIGLYLRGLPTTVGALDCQARVDDIFAIPARLDLEVCP